MDGLVELAWDEFILKDYSENEELVNTLIPKKIVDIKLE